MVASIWRQLARRRFKLRQNNMFQRRSNPFLRRTIRSRAIPVRQWAIRPKQIPQQNRIFNRVQRPQISHFGTLNNRKQVVPRTLGGVPNGVYREKLRTHAIVTMSDVPLPRSFVQLMDPIVRRGRNGRRRRMLRVSSLNTDTALWRSIGMRLVDKLRPNRTRIDLFNKEYRAQIVRNYILKNGGLNNIGTNLKKADGKEAIDLSNEIQFPSRIGRMFAISIQPMRFENLKARLGPWEKHLTLWPGTNGHLIDKTKWVRDGIAVPRLKRGEMGCYDSHYRLWKHISENNIPTAFILEDDADVNYSHSVANAINKMFDELQKHGVQYDLIYLGHNNNKKPRKMIGGSLGVPGGVQGLFAYHLTLEGARKLIQGAIPMTQAVDDYAYVSLKRVRQFILEPRLCWVVPIEQSDTANIV